MDYLYSLYDALVSIHVPNDKARAVVDAMERDMGTTIATKADLQLLRQEMATKVDLAGLRQEFALLRKDFEVFSASFSKDLDVKTTGFHKALDVQSASFLKDLDVQSTGFHKDLAAHSASFQKDLDVQSIGFHKDLAAHSASFHKDLELLSTTMTVRLGSMLVVGFGVMIAALKYLQS